LKKTWFKKNNLRVFCFFKYGFFEKKRIFVFLEKSPKPYSELFLLHHAVSPFLELHNNSFLYLLWHSNVRVKKCTPSLFSQCCWSLSMHTEKSHSHTNSAASLQAYMPC